MCSVQLINHRVNEFNSKIWSQIHHRISYAFYTHHTCILNIYYSWNVCFFNIQTYLLVWLHYYYCFFNKNPVFTLFDSRIQCLKTYYNCVIFIYYTSICFNYIVVIYVRWNILVLIYYLVPLINLKIDISYVT